MILVSYRNIILHSNPTYCKAIPCSELCITAKHTARGWGEAEALGNRRALQSKMKLSTCSSSRTPWMKCSGDRPENSSVNVASVSLKHDPNVSKKDNVLFALQNGWQAR